VALGHARVDALLAHSSGSSDLAVVATVRAALGSARSKADAAVTVIVEENQTK